MTDWLAALRADVGQAAAQAVSLFANVTEHRRRAAEQLDRTLARHGAAAERRDTHHDAQLHAHAMTAFATGRYAALTTKEQRYAARQFAHATAAQMRDLLAAHPHHWRTFATACLRRWDELDSLSDRSAYTRLLALAPPDIRCLHGTLRPQDAVGTDGPQRLAAALATDDLRDALERARERGFEPSWGYTACALAWWMHARSQQPRAFDRFWTVLAADPQLAAMLLPAPPDVPRPARAQAHAIAAAALIRARPSASGGAWAAFTDGLLRSTFGDPRIPPESTGWKRLQRADEGAYRAFLELLITEDLKLFFQHAMSDRRRETFWLRYIKAVRRTTAILDGGTHTRLAGARDQLAAATARARRFGKRSSISAFCLYFDRIVVVEFSESGNAAQIYDRAEFERRFERAIDANRCPDPGSLKQPQSAENRIIHVGAWEQLASEKLRAFGVAT